MVLTALSDILFPPAHCVVVVRVTETGGFQLAAHHCTGALVSCQVALQTALTVHTRSLNTTQNKTFSGKSLFFFPLSKTFQALRFPDRIGQCLDDAGVPNLDRAAMMEDCFHERGDVPFLTVQIRVLSVPRPLPPEGNDRLGFSLVVQSLHAACCIGTGKTNKPKN